jgi:hypothetical protein
MNKALSRNGMHFNPDHQPYPFDEGFHPVGITDSNLKKSLLSKLSSATVSAIYKSKGEIKANSHCKEFKKVIPSKLYNSFFPKRFKNVPDFCDPRLFGVANLFTYLEHGTNSEDDGTATAAWRDLHVNLLGFNYPVYFLDETTEQMIIDSKLDPTLTLADIEFVLPSFLVCLPKKDLRSDYIATIGVTRSFEMYNPITDTYTSNLDQEWEYMGGCNSHNMNKMIVESGDGPWREIGDAMLEHWANMDINDESGRINTSVFQEPDVSNEMWRSGQYKIEPVFNVGCVSANMLKLPARFRMDDPVPVAELIERNRALASSLKALPNQKYGTPYTDGTISPDEYGKPEWAGPQMSDMLEFTLKIMAFMAAKPEEVSTVAEQTQPVKVRRGYTLRESEWSPNIIGKRYGATLRRQGYTSDDGDKDKNRPHWRRAHQRRQRYGKHSAKEKLIWVDAVFVNDPEKKNIEP